MQIDKKYDDIFSPSSSYMKPLKQVMSHDILKNYQMQSMIFKKNIEEDLQITN